MRFLGDESCDHALLRALRGAGHDVIAVSEIAPTADDGIVIAMARDDKRILLTEDRDFGQLVFAHGHPTAGIIYVRIRGSERPTMGSHIVDIVARLGDRLLGAFVVVTPGRVRIGRPSRR